LEAALTALRETHAGETEALRERAEAAEQRADVADLDRRVAQERAERAEQRAEEAAKRADVAMALADRCMAQLADAADRAERAGVEADALRTTIDEIRAGQTLMAETHARDLAEAIRQAQDAAEETIRQRVERLEQDRAKSVAIADEAVRAAEQLRQAATDGKGRGRWARLRQAWRGE